MFENGFRTITDYVIHLWSWNFIHLLPMSQGYALLILGSKGQRSRSWIIDVWKWFPDHNWLCNPYKFGVGSGFLVNFWVALYPCTNESRMFNSCLYKGFLQLGFLHLWCTFYLLVNKIDSPREYFQVLYLQSGVPKWYIAVKNLVSSRKLTATCCVRNFLRNIKVPIWIKILTPGSCFMRTVLKSMKMRKR